MYGFRLPLPLLLLLETPDEEDAADRGVEGVAGTEDLTATPLGLDTTEGDGLLELVP